MGRSMGCQSIGGNDGNADELTKWDGTKKNVREDSGLHLFFYNF